MLTVFFIHSSEGRTAAVDVTRPIAAVPVGCGCPFVGCLDWIPSLRVTSIDPDSFNAFFQIVFQVTFYYGLLPISKNAVNSLTTTIVRARYLLDLQLFPCARLIAQFNGV